VAICISILAVMAVTSYEYATIKSRRANAQACLTEHSQYMERHYTTHMTYVGADEPGCSAEVSEHYEFTFSAEPTASAYTLQAKPLGRQEEAEQDCGTMTIDQVGRKTPAEHCW
jgi:type IV pilus assembly protein PilE